MPVQVSRCASSDTDLPFSSGLHGDQGPDGIPVAGGPHQMKGDPVVFVAAVVSKEGAFVVQVHDVAVQVTVVVIIPEAGAAAHLFLLKIGAQFQRGIPEFLTVQVLEDLVLLPVEVFQLPVHLEYVHITVVVKIDERGGPPHMLGRCHGDPRRIGHVHENPVPLVLIEGAVGIVGHEHIDEAVAVIIGKVHRHADGGLPGLVERHSGPGPLIHEFLPLLVMVNVVDHVIVGHENIDPAIPVEIGGTHPHGPAVMVVDSHRFGDVFKGTIAQVVIEPVQLPVIGHRPRKSVRCVKVPVLGIIVDIVPHIKVQVPVVVIVQPHRPHTAFVPFHARLPADVPEGAVAIVEVEHIGPVIGHIDIGIAVVVEVPHGHPHAVPRISDASLPGNIFKGAVLPVPVKPVYRISLRPFPFAQVFGVGAAAHIKIKVTVLVIIEKNGSAAHRFHQVVQVVVPDGVLEIHPQVRGDLLKKIAIGFRNTLFRLPGSVRVLFSG